MHNLINVLFVHEHEVYTHLSNTLDNPIIQDDYGSLHTVIKQYLVEAFYALVSIPSLTPEDKEWYFSQAKQIFRDLDTVATDAATHINFTFYLNKLVTCDFPFNDDFNEDFPFKSPTFDKPPAPIVISPRDDIKEQLAFQTPSSNKQPNVDKLHKSRHSTSKHSDHSTSPHVPTKSTGVSTFTMS